MGDTSEIAGVDARSLPFYSCFSSHRHYLTDALIVLKLMINSALLALLKIELQTLPVSFCSVTLQSEVTGFIFDHERCILYMFVTVNLQACQCTELDSLIPLQFGATKLVLVGDPEQLPPTVISQVRVLLMSSFSLVICEIILLINFSKSKVLVVC